MWRVVITHCLIRFANFHLFCWQHWICDMEQMREGSMNWLKRGRGQQLSVLPSYLAPFNAFYYQPHERNHIQNISKIKRQKIKRAIWVIEKNFWNGKSKLLRPFVNGENRSRWKPKDIIKDVEEAITYIGDKHVGETRSWFEIILVKDSMSLSLANVNVDRQRTI